MNTVSNEFAQQHLLGSQQKEDIEHFQEDSPSRAKMSASTQKAPTQNVNNEDASGRKNIFPCIICQLHCDSGIKCNTCNMWSHHVCSGVPTHLGIMLVNTNRKYTCQPCARQSFSDYAT